jgi:hypothetical protein
MADGFSTSSSPAMPQRAVLLIGNLDHCRQEWESLSSLVTLKVSCIVDLVLSDNRCIRTVIDALSYRNINMEHVQTL